MENQISNNLTPKSSFTTKKIILGLLAAITIGIGSYIGYHRYTTYQQSIPYTVNAPEEIKGTIITLKMPKEEYFLDFHNMFSDTVRKNLEFPKHISLGYTIAYLREEMKKSAKGEQLWYMIFDNKDNKLIGGIEIRELNDIDPGQLGCWINENYWGGGRLQEALHLITKMYFSLKPQEKSYIAHVRLWNKRSYYALKKYGLKEVGYFYENGQPARYLLEMHRDNVNMSK